MINRYRRAARSATELRLGELASMVEAIAELADVAAKIAVASGQRRSAGRRGETLVETNTSGW
jgi:hypothetical protein